MELQLGVSWPPAASIPQEAHYWNGHAIQWNTVKTLARDQPELDQLASTKRPHKCMCMCVRSRRWGESEGASLWPDVAEEKVDC